MQLGWLKKCSSHPAGVHFKCKPQPEVLLLLQTSKQTILSDYWEALNSNGSVVQLHCTTTLLSKVEEDKSNTTVGQSVWNICATTGDSLKTTFTCVNNFSTNSLN